MDRCCDRPISPGTGAHFSIPPAWLTASLINKTTYDDLLTVVETEFDWPQQSAVRILATVAVSLRSSVQYLQLYLYLYSYSCSYTSYLCHNLLNLVGYRMDIFHCHRTGAVSVPVHARAEPLHPPRLYLSLLQLLSLPSLEAVRMLTLSLADQNVGVNGARSTAMAPGPNNTGIIRTLARNADCMYPVAVAVALAVAVADASVVDYPAIVTFELVGNDVCTPHPTFDRVRPPFPVVLVLLPVIGMVAMRAAVYVHVHVPVTLLVLYHRSDDAPRRICGECREVPGVSRHHSAFRMRSCFCRSQ